MISRRAHVQEVRRRLRSFPVVGIVGPRQVGKTTLALQVARSARGPVHRFDLEDSRDLDRLTEPIVALERLRGLVILDDARAPPRADLECIRPGPLLLRLGQDRAIVPRLPGFDLDGADPASLVREPGQAPGEGPEGLFPRLGPAAPSLWNRHRGGSPRAPASRRLVGGLRDRGGHSARRRPRGGVLLLANPHGRGAGPADRPWKEARRLRGQAVALSRSHPLHAYRLHGPASLAAARRPLGDEVVSAGRGHRCGPADPDRARAAARAGASVQPRSRGGSSVEPFVR